MENINFRNIPTKFELNGPILTITQHPVAASGCPGTSAIFTANATATFPTQDPANPAIIYNSETETRTTNPQPHLTPYPYNPTDTEFS